MGDFKPDTVVVQEHASGMAAMPAPAGSWQAHHSKRNTRWNMQIAGATVLMVLSMIGAKAAGVFEFHEIKDVTKVKISLD